MPMLIDHIDAIVRRRGCDTLFVVHDVPLGGRSSKNNPMTALKAFLDEQSIPWSPCAPPSDSGWIEGGPEMLWFDVPFDTANPQYQTLAGYLEHPDGRPKDHRLKFLYMTVELAEKYQTGGRHE